MMKYSISCIKRIGSDGTTPYGLNFPLYQSNHLIGLSRSSLHHISWGKGRMESKIDHEVVDTLWDS